MRTESRRNRFVEQLERRCLLSASPLFDLSAPDTAPFPSDHWTVADPAQLTGRRVDLPLPDAAARPSDAADLSVINTLDGFNPQPRLSVPFSGPIDVTSVNSDSVFLIKLEDPTVPDEGGGAVVGIDQVVWDPGTNTLHAESDELLEQHTRYALVVTRGVRGADGQAVNRSRAFARFRRDLNLGQADDPDLKAYRKNLLDALATARRIGVAGRDIAAASVFTTMSVTATLEKMRDQIHAATPPQADFALGPGGSRTAFDLGSVAGITFNQQTRVTGALNPVPLQVQFLNDVPGAVGSVAFGKYRSPEYQVHPGEYIPPVATGTGSPDVQALQDVYFSLFLPAGEAPAGGWPVVLYAHSTISHKDDESFRFASTMANDGLATMAITGAGNGFGPLSTLGVRLASGDTVTFPSGGRSIDQDGNGLIGGTEGQSAGGNFTILRDSDSLRQTAADLVQLVRVIQAGIDADGDGTHDLDPSRISLTGFSFGASLSTMLFAVEPALTAAVFNVPSGPRIEAGRLRVTPIGFRRADVGTTLATREPSLINAPGVTAIGGVAVAAPYFDENIPLRDGVPYTVRLADGTARVVRSPVTNTVSGAMAIQEVFEWTEWVSQSANPVAYSPHLRKDPLAGVPVRPVLFQFAIGDQAAPNPTAAAILTAGDLADRAILYRNELAFAENPAVPKNPHAFITRIDSPIPLVREVALGAQRQMAAFLASGGANTIDPDPNRFFEPVDDLSELGDLNYIA